MVWAVLNPKINAALKELIRDQNSDRIVGIVGGAMLDENLRRALELRFRPKSGKTDMNDKIFRVAGPLGNLAPKIDLGYQLYMLEKTERNTMYGIAEIRNLFAHHLEMSFQDTSSKMTEALKKLTMHVGLTKYPVPTSAPKENPQEYELEPIKTNRDLFIVNLKLALLFLMHDYDKHLPYSNAPANYTVGSARDYSLKKPSTLPQKLL